MNDVHISISIRALRGLLDAFEECIASTRAQLESAQESRVLGAAAFRDAQLAKAGTAAAPFTTQETAP